MFIGWITFDLLLGDVQSLKQKRAVVRPILAKLRRFEASVAETGHQDLHRRAELSAGVVAGEVARVVKLLDELERYVAALPEVDLISARRGLHSSEDE